jgi:hypothetical protein
MFSNSQILCPLPAADVQAPAQSTVSVAVKLCTQHCQYDDIRSGEKPDDSYGLVSPSPL